MLEIQFHLTDNDYITFNEYHMQHSSSYKKVLLFNKFFGSVVCLVLIVLFFIFSDDLLIIITEAIVLGALSIIMIMRAKNRMRRNIEKQIKAVKKDGRLPYEPDGKLVFTDEEIIEITSDYESRTNYSLIEKICITDEAVYIYTSSVQACIIPNTSFQDEAEKEQFLTFLRTKFPELFIN
ncbi:MAG: YcxB family protein [Lachnospiraceae bacterium]|nr:YcxB family protein [Lachnospiraceae bacterium]